MQQQKPPQDGNLLSNNNLPQIEDDAVFDELEEDTGEDWLEDGDECPECSKMTVYYDATGAYCTHCGWDAYASHMD